MLGRSLSEEKDLSEEAESSENEEAEYRFEGFTIEFSEKIMLTPAGQVGTRKGKV